MSIIPVTEKPVSDQVNSSTYVLCIQNNSSGDPALYRIPIDLVLAGDNVFLPKTGGTIDGSLTVSGITHTDLLGILHRKSGTIIDVFCLPSSGQGKPSVLGLDSQEGAGIIIRNVATPEKDTDAVNRKYVEDNFLPKTGGELTGELIIPEGSVSARWVNLLSGSEELVGAYIEVGYRNQTPVVEFKNEDDDSPVIISRVRTPEMDWDAANKGYVDGKVGDIDTALDSIIAIQNSLIGGDVA